jgi:hypothetical protein
VWRCVCSNRRAWGDGIYDRSLCIIQRRDLSVAPTPSQVEEMQHHVSTSAWSDAVVSLIIRYTINTHVSNWMSDHFVLKSKNGRLPGTTKVTLRFKLLKTKCNLLYIRNQSVPTCKHFPPRL